MTRDEQFAAARAHYDVTVAPFRLPVALCADSREQVPYHVAARSIAQTSPRAVVRSLDIRGLIARGLYNRPTERRDGRLWDVISEAPMATEHAIARFFVPALYDYRGWVLSADCDILVRSDLAELFALADDRYAVMVVKHQQPDTGATKMDGQVQTAYQRKNWSSVCLYNCAHPAHLVLNPATPFGILNRWPGRDLHAFGWLKDEEIGELPVEWNWLVGVSPSVKCASCGDGLLSRMGADGHAPNCHMRGATQIAVKPAICHFTLGTCDMPGYEHQSFADEWRAYTEQGIGVVA